jgi:hypothetical protein
MRGFAFCAPEEPSFWEAEQAASHALLRQIGL